MAACRRWFVGQLSSPRIPVSLLNDGFIVARGVLQSCPSRGIATSAAVMKNTPRTVGVPAWAKAAQRRRRSLAKLEKPKTQEQIEAEHHLSNDPTNLDFYTTTRNARPQATMSVDDLPESTITKNNKAFVIYHPEKQDPMALLYSKDATVKPWWYLSDEEIKDYRDNLTEEEILEAQQLRDNDPLLWTVNSLSRLYKVKPLTIALAAPLSEDQKLAVDVERKLLLQWTDYKRKDYRANQELERQKYIEKTRGIEMNKALGLK